MVKRAKVNIAGHMICPKVWRALDVVYAAMYKSCSIKAARAKEYHGRQTRKRRDECMCLP